MDSANQDPNEEEPIEESAENDEPMASVAGPDFYQQRMHIENSRRLGRLESSHEKMMNVLTRIEANTKDLPTIKADVDELKESRAKVKGALWVAMAGGPVLSWLAARFFKW